MILKIGKIKFCPPNTCFFGANYIVWCKLYAFLLSKLLLQSIWDIKCKERNPLTMNYDCNIAENIIHTELWCKVCNWAQVQLIVFVLHFKVSLWEKNYTLYLKRNKTLSTTKFFRGWTVLVSYQVNKAM